MTTARQVYEQHVLPEIELLLRAALRLCNQPSDAEDLVQETLLNAWRAIEGFDGRYPRAWLLTILRTTHLKMHRRQRPGLLHDPDTALDSGRRAARQASAEDVVLDQRLGSPVEGALRQLPEPQRQVVMLVDIDLLSYAETAQVLGIPRGTVMSRLHRARTRLRETLGSHEPAPAGPKANG